MKHFLKTAPTIVALLLILIMLIVRPVVRADWWDRPDVSPTRPVYDREDELTPTSDPSVPTPTSIRPSGAVTPTAGGDPNPSITSGAVNKTPTPTQKPAIGGTEDSDEDPCEDGKSYVGPHCGWSPDHDVKEDSDPGDWGGYQDEDPGTRVKGLSYTSSGKEQAGVSDIILFTGVLCLLLYARSKLERKELIRRIR